ncbi:hypothetical protein BJX76DRAFT_365942 [Aspergillus varians]
MSSRRRNGQAASCEPCRKDKVRCDHRVPVCGRCQKRNAGRGCFYHPAPLTREGDSPASRLGTRRTPRSSKLHSRKEGQGPASPTPSSVEITIRSPDTNQSLPPGYFGPTSFVSTFYGSPEINYWPPNGDPQMLGNGHSVLPSYWVPETTKMLGILTESSTIEKLVHGFYNASQSGVLPTRLVFSLIAEMRNIIEENETPEALHRKTAQILESTAQRPQIPSDIKGKDFHKLFTGTCMRLEIMGVLFALAGRASFFGFAPENFTGPDGGSAARFKFARRMLTASSPTWHRLGELSSCVFELGLHRDGHKAEDMPIFLREIRRRLFASLYHVDKNIATFFGRPPHVSWRYSDSKPPLDISEDALVGDDQDLEQAMQELDSEGWNSNAMFRRASWYRVRCLNAGFREEILELSLRPVHAEAAEKLRDISFRCTQAWNSLPAHLRYSPDDWNDNNPVGVRVMLIASYLMYLYEIFLIQRLLTQHDPSAETDLLSVSSKILSAVLMLGRQQEHTINIQRDFNSTIILYGFPSASSLIKALQAQARTGHPIPYTGSRAELIRNLSVFISHIEAMARPLTSNINHALFDRATKMFTNILDEILESRLPVSSSTVAGAAEVEVGVSTSATAAAAEEEDLDSSWAVNGMEFLEVLDFSAVFDQWVF